MSEIRFTNVSFGYLAKKFYDIQTYVLGQDARLVSCKLKRVNNLWSGVIFYKRRAQ